MSSFAMKKVKPVNGKGGQRGNTNSRKDTHGSDDMAIMDTVLRARCRQMGWRPTEANLRTAKSTCLETAAGRAILGDAVMNGVEVNQDRLAACDNIRYTFHTYWRLIGKKHTANNAAIQLMPDDVFTDPDAKPREELTEEQQADRFKAVGNRKQKLITWISLGAGIHAEQFTNVITLDHEAKAGFIPMLDRVMGEMK